MVERILTKCSRWRSSRLPERLDGNGDAAHLATSTQVAEEGTVLLKNSGNLLPLNPTTVGSIAVIGTDASVSLQYGAVTRAG